MWLDACEMLDQVERLHKKFFLPGESQATAVAWEPPLDILETDNGLTIHATLPGVKPEQIQIFLKPDSLTIVGFRAVFGVEENSPLMRLEIPYGRLYGKIGLAHTDYEIVFNEIVDGCLQLTLRRPQA